MLKKIIIDKLDIIEGFKHKYISNVEMTFVAMHTFYLSIELSFNKYILLHVI